MKTRFWKQFPIKAICLAVAAIFCMGAGNVYPDLKSTKEGYRSADYSALCQDFLQKVAENVGPDVLSPENSLLTEDVFRTYLTDEGGQLGLVNDLLAQPYVASLQCVARATGKSVEFVEDFTKMNFLIRVNFIRGLSAPVIDGIPHDVYTPRTDKPPLTERAPKPYSKDGGIVVEFDRCRLELCFDWHRSFAIPYELRSADNERLGYTGCSTTTNIGNKGAQFSSWFSRLARTYRFDNLARLNAKDAFYSAALCYIFTIQNEVSVQDFRAAFPLAAIR